MGNGYKKLIAAAVAALCLLAGCAGRTVPPASVSQAAPAAGGSAQPLPTLQEIMDPAGQVWHYLDDPQRLAQIDGGWTDPAYNDDGWLMASGAFGAYEGRLEPVEGENPTVCLRHYLPNGLAVPTYYFRLPFTVRADEMTDTLTAEIAYDDAVIVYLNGAEIFAGNTPEQGYTGPNAYGCEKYFDDVPHSTVVLDPALLREGENVLCVELHQASEDSSDIFFAMEELRSASQQIAALRNDTLCLGVGADETQLLITWRGPIGADAFVAVEPCDNGAQALTDAAVVWPAQSDYEETDEGLCTYRAVITGLTPGKYLYQAVDVAPSATNTFTVAAPEGAFSFLSCGDPQIEGGGDPGAMATWQAMAEYLMGDENPSFVLSLGDQVDDSGDAGEYRAFTAAPLFKTAPLAAVVGNHEQDSRMFSRVFSLPNMDAATKGDSGSMSGDYWFFRGNTLFLCLNSNNDDTDAHRDFLLQARQQCVERYREPVWTVAAFHHALFSVGEHAKDGSIEERRSPYTAMLAEAGVDVVFSGHDHTYTRSWPMNGIEPLTDGSADGIVYFTLGSSTGSKYYDQVDEQPNYAAFANGDRLPAMTRVDVTDTTFTVTTVQFVDGACTVLDTCQITRDAA